jgi:hypothetical protein
MKTIFLILFYFCLASTFFSCSSPEKKIKNAILQDLKMTLHDFKSYEPIQFGQIEVATSEYTDLPEYKSLMKQIDVCMKEADNYNELKRIYENSEYSRDKYWANLKLQLRALENAKVCDAKIDSIKLHFSSQTIGWQITHRFRAKNLAGNLSIHDYLFVVDKEYKKVIKSKDLSEN